MLHTTGTSSLRLYWINASLLGAHEVDSGYWREWELFGLPGGADLFVLIHIPLFMLVFWGYGQGLRATRAGMAMSWGVACAGLFAIAAHGWFLASGRPEFRSPMSTGLLMAIGVVSVLQCLTLAMRSRAPAR